MRAARRLPQERTTSLDNRTLYSVQYGHAGRPDRMIEENIPDGWRSARRVHDSHRVQLGVYFILIKEETGERPTHGFISLDSGELVRVENTTGLQYWVLGVAERIREARREMEREIPVRQPPAKYRGCGMREGCGQRSY